jgi:hypothetical protein
MQELVPYILALWVAMTVVLFATRRGRESALLAMIAGWALLPNARYPSTVFGTPVGTVGSMHALAVPTSILVNKATAIGLACLAGVMLFDWPVLRRVRPHWCDFPITVWCTCPIAAALANGLPLAEGLAQARYLALAWGVPYVIGRVYVGTSDSLRQIGLGMVLAGLCYLPVCLLEFVLGPFLYGTVYGAHPYQLEGATRPVLHRPLVFLEHGNQLGLWVALATVSATWLWATGRLRRLGNVPGRFVAAALIAQCVVCQSHEAIILMALALAPLLVVSRGWTVSARPKVAATLAVVAIVTVAAAVGLALAAETGVLRQSVRRVFSQSGKSSFTWRLARAEENLPRIAERPVLGWSRADWSARPGGTFDNPVNIGLPVLAAGMFGMIGLTAVIGVFLSPVIEVGRWLPLRAWSNPRCSPVTLVALLLLISLADALLNSTVVLPVIAGAGGLNTWSQRRGLGD